MITYMLLIALFGPLAGAVVIGFTKKHIRYTQWISAIISLTGFIAFLLVNYKYGVVTGINIDVGMPFPIKLGTDALGIYMGLISCFVWTLASVYSVEYIEHRKTIFNVFLMLSLFGMLGIVLASNIFTLLLFFELFSIASAILIIHDLTKKAIVAGFQYLFISVLGTVAIIIATALIFKATGSIDFAGHGLSGLNGLKDFSLIFVLMIFGFSIKAGLFPVHVWLPEAHPIAPSSASALLSGVMIKAGAYGIIRTIYSVFGTEVVTGKEVITVLIAVAVFTMIYGSLLAITQTEFKRLLAYSSVAQIGYVVLGAALISQAGLKGGLFHIFAHAFMKGALFLSAGTIIHQTGIKKIADLKGLGRYMPVTMLVITLSALSMIGIPPFSGFLSKWMLAQGAFEAGSLGVISKSGAYVIVGALVLSGLLNVLYYAPIIIMGWLKEPKLAMTGASHDAEVRNLGNKGGWLEPSWKMLAPALILAVGTLFFGIFPGIPMSLSEEIVRLLF